MKSWLINWTRLIQDHVHDNEAHERLWSKLTHHDWLWTHTIGAMCTQRFHVHGDGAHEVHEHHDEASSTELKNNYEARSF